MGVKNPSNKTATAQPQLESAWMLNPSDGTDRNISEDRVNEISMKDPLNKTAPGEPQLALARMVIKSDRTGNNTDSSSSNSLLRSQASCNSIQGDIHGCHWVDCDDVPLEQCLNFCSGQPDWTYTCSYPSGVCRCQAGCAYKDIGGQCPMYIPGSVIGPSPEFLRGLAPVSMSMPLMYRNSVLVTIALVLS